MVGAVASGINAVAGGGSLISFPYLTFGIGLPERIANATNSVGLFPGSLAGGFGFKNLFQKTGHYLRALLLPTAIGSVAGSLLLLNTSDAVFKEVIPFLIFLAALLLLFQPKVKALVGKGGRTLPVWAGVLLQFLVSVYGGYFGAGMGIMMLGCFALYIEGNVHELNAIKNWLSLLVNFTCSIVFVFKGLVMPTPALWVILGSLVGGFFAARISQRFDPNRLRLVIAIYGLGMSAYFAWHAFAK
ncbi:MAG TPA: sulfite exporter TauE/SafE family protein [Verrucomicrobiae bacterium]|nr:sulfite exporter TauE/SafE family protein [Verrucomicrobiae bacterium]